MKTKKSSRKATSDQRSPVRIYTTTYTKLDELSKKHRLPIIQVLDRIVAKWNELPKVEKNATLGF